MKTDDICYLEYICRLLDLQNSSYPTQPHSIIESEEMIIAVKAIYAIALRSLKKIQDFNGV